VKYIINIILITTLGQFIFGLYLAYLLGSLPKFEVSKLINVTGLVFDIFGVLILSNLVFEKSDRFTYLFDYLFAFSMSALMVIPLGIFFGQMMVLFTKLPSIKATTTFAGSVMLYVGMPLYATDSLGDALKLNFYKSIKFRTKFLGWYFLISGFIFQFVAGIVDLIN